MGIRKPACLMLLVSSVIATFAFADGQVAVPVDGEPFQGSLVAADPTGATAFQTNDKNQRLLAAGELVRWGSCSEPDRAPVFLLRDGTVLVAGILEATDSGFTLDSENLGLVRLPQEQLAAMVLRLPASRLQCDQTLDGALDAAGETARVVLLNGDRLDGQVATIDDRSVSLRTAVGPVHLEFSRISTLTFASLSGVPGTSPGDHTIVGLSDGTRVATKALSLQEGKASLQTVGGLRWEADGSDIVFLQPACSRIVYLSDLPPAGYRHVPYLDRTWRFQTDRNALEGMLRCAGQLHLKGLGMHTAARLTYDVPRGAVRFQSEIGIDDVTHGMGSVRFRIFVDGSQKYMSPTVPGLEAPIPVSVDLSGAKRLDLVVDFADRADVQDQANWLDARFVLGK